MDTDQKRDEEVEVIDHTHDDDLIPDGGYDWIVLAGCTVVAAWSIGTAQSWGVLQSAFVETGVSSSVNLLWVGSLSAGLVSAFAILYAKVMRTVGPRTTGLGGILLMSASGGISSVVYKDIGSLFGAYGVLMGIGMGFTFTTVAVAPTQYFLRKRGIANGIVLAGGGLGGAIISVGLNALIQSIGLAWALRVHCLLVAVTGLPAAYAIRERVAYRAQGLIDKTLFRDVRFSLSFVAGVLGTFPLFVPPYCVPIFATSVQLSQSTGSALAAAFNVSSAVGRISSGFLCDRVGALNTLFASLFLLGTTMFAVWPFASTLVPLTVFVILSGIFAGGLFTSMPTVVGHTFGSARMSVAMGMILTGWTGGYLMGPPVAGYVIESSGGTGNGIGPYRPAMYYAGALAFASATVVAVTRVRTSKKLLKRV